MIQLYDSDLNDIFKNFNINQILNNNDMNKISLLLGYNSNFIKLLEKNKYINIFLIYFNEITITNLKDFTNNISLFAHFIKVILSENNIYNFDISNINYLITFLERINKNSSDFYKVLKKILQFY